MLELGIQVYGVVMTAAFPAHVQHVRPSQVADQSPDRALSERHVFRDLTDRAPRVHGDVEEDGAVTGNQIPVVDYRDAVARHYNANWTLRSTLIRVLQ